MSAKKRVQSKELIDDALNYSKAHKRSYKDDKWRFEKLRKHFGDRPADGIIFQEIERYLAAKFEHDKWAPATPNRCRAVLSLAYRLGIRNGEVSANPARLVRHRVENNARVRWLKQKEEQALRERLEANAPEHLPEFDLAFNTGMRLSEMNWRTWEDVNLERRILTVPRSKHGERRHVPLNSTAMAALAELKAKDAVRGWVFRNERGERLTGPRYWFEDAIAESKIHDSHWHDLRHTFASHPIIGGMNLRTVQELMGHKTIAMTCRYAHLSPTYQLAAVERLAEINRAIKEGKAEEAKTEALTDTRALEPIPGQPEDAAQVVIM